MWKVAIIDDQKKDIDQLRHCIEKYAENNQDKFHIEVFRDALFFLDKYKPVYDIVFMDIDMPGMDGLKAAHRLRELDSIVQALHETYELINVFDSESETGNEILDVLFSEKNSFCRLHRISCNI